jgi:sugar phosphate isomerase/epimerase
MLIDDYRISLWNYFWYYTEGSLEDLVDEVRESGYGIELWDRWKEDRGLYQPKYHDRLRAMTDGMKVSLHGRSCQSREDHLEQLATAKAVAADVIVVHLGHFPGADGQTDLALMKEMAERCRDAGVSLALENGRLDALAQAFDHCGEALGFCFDTGHKEGLKEPIPEFLAAFGRRLCHIHLQDPEETADHWELGTGVNAAEDWRLLKEHLKNTNFQGAAVFEIRPRRPSATAERSIQFLEGV